MTFILYGSIVRRRIEHMPATRRFHSKYMYNNYMYMLAGVIAERISGLSWEQLITTRIFQPLSMTSSSFVRHVRGHVDIALPHESFDGHVQPLDLDVLRYSDQSFTHINYQLYFIKGTRDNSAVGNCDYF